MHYEIRGEYPNQQFLKIRATIPVQDNQVELQFPKWRPGRYELGNFAKNVRAFQVFDAQGKSLEFYKTDTHVWIVQGIQTQSIVVKYDYYAAELNAGSSFLSPDMLYVNPVNCLVYIKGLENESCTLHVKLNRPMQFAGTLPEKDGLMHAESYHDLVDSPFVYCDTICSEVYSYGGVDFRVSFIGLNQAPWERVLQDFQKFTKAQFDDFGHFPSKTFHFINIITPYPHYHGVEHRASTMIVLGPNYKIFEDYYDELLGVSSHELYHVWNVKSIRSVDLYPYDYSRENLSNMGYLCEGITTYLGDYYLMKSRIWSPEKYLREWEQVIQKHVDNPARFNSSLAESSFDTWLDGYVPGAPGRKTSIYNEGALFAFITDIFIRKKTKGELSILHVMKELYHRFFMNNLGVTDQDFVNVVEEISKSTYQSLFQELIYSRTSLEGHTSAALNAIGLELKLSPNSNPIEARLGIKTTYEQGAAKIQTMLPNSSAAHAGLMLGDKILGVNNFAVQNDLEHWMKHFENQDLQFLLNRQGKLIQLNVNQSSERFFNQVRIKKSENPSELEIALYRSWIGEQSELV